VGVVLILSQWEVHYIKVLICEIELTDTRRSDERPKTRLSKPVLTETWIDTILENFEELEGRKHKSLCWLPRRPLFLAAKVVPGFTFSTLTTCTIHPFILAIREIWTLNIHRTIQRTVTFFACVKTVVSHRVSCMYWVCSYDKCEIKTYIYLKIVFYYYTSCGDF